MIGKLLNAATTAFRPLTDRIPDWMVGTLQIMFPVFMLANANMFRKLPIAGDLFHLVGNMTEQFAGSLLSGNFLPMLGGLAEATPGLEKLGDLAQTLAPLIQTEPEAENVGQILAWAFAQKLTGEE